MTTELPAAATVAGVELEYEVRGSGEPVVLIHAGVCARWFERLLQEPALAERYQLVRYHRAGYASSSRPGGAVSIADHAGHGLALLGHLGIERAHFVGHSSSAMMALQLALDAPAVVQSLALLESARPAPSSPVQAAFVETVVRPALALFAAGHAEAAVDTWMAGTCGPGYRAVFERVVPGAFEECVADASTFFGQELPAVQQWTFGPDEASRVVQRVLTVLGTESRPTFAERRELLLGWLPNVEAFDLQGASHLMPVQDPRRLAEALASFFARHPLASG